MLKEKVYLDTSIPSAYYDERAKERQKVTKKFWHEVLPNFRAYISVITLEEISAIYDEKLKGSVNELVEDFIILNTNNKIAFLAKTYIEKGVLPEKYYEDALHVAFATYNKIQFLVSWNFHHLVNVKTRKFVNLINNSAGFGLIEIVSPQEL